MKSLYDSSFYRFLKKEEKVVVTKTVLIADLHIGKVSYDAETYFENELKYLLEDLKKMDFTNIVLLGDISDRPITGSALKVYHKFLIEMMIIATSKGAAIRLLHGTASHEGNMFSHITHYLRLFPNLKIIYSASKEVLPCGLKVLYLPHESVYNYEEKYGELVSETYDMVFGHGEIEGPSWYMKDVEVHDNKRSVLWRVGMLKKLGDQIVFGHIHDRMELCDNVRYCGSYSTYTFHDTIDKKRGYEVIEYNVSTKINRVTFIENKRRREFMSIDITDVLNSDRNIDLYMMELKEKYDEKNTTKVRLVIRVADVKPENNFKIKHVTLLLPDNIILHRVLKSTTDEDREQRSLAISRMMSDSVSVEELINEYINDKYKVDIPLQEIEQIIN